MSSKKLSFAADILQASLKNDTELKEGLEMKENETVKRSKQTVESVKYFCQIEIDKIENKTKEGDSACFRRGVYLCSF